MSVKSLLCVIPALVLAAHACVPALVADCEWPVLRLVDGDTVAVDASADMPPELARLSVRLHKVHTPEKGQRAKCDAKRKNGQAVTAFSETEIAAAEQVVVRDPKWGKYGGGAAWWQT